MSLNSKAVISSRGQVVIPSALREKLSLHAGRELIFNVRHDGVIELKPLVRSIDQFFGRCKRANEAAMSIEDMDIAIAQAIIENNLESPKEKHNDRRRH